MSKIALTAHKGDKVAILNTIAPRTVLTADCGHRWEYDLQTTIYSCRCGTRFVMPPPARGRRPAGRPSSR